MLVQFQLENRSHFGFIGGLATKELTKIVRTKFQESNQ